MKILLIGSGGREHALAYALARSSNNVEVFANPGNPGIFNIAKEANFDLKDFNQAVNFCKTNKIELVVIGPEQFLADGLSDILRENGISVFGPSKSAARLETSKIFSKEFMLRNSIPTANYKSFETNQKDDALKFIEDSKLPIVIKADGLAAGKGVVVANILESAKEAVKSMFDGQFGSAGSNIVIEEFLTGEEASILAITDGNDFITLSPSQDHKRAFDNDEGPNTGGMGVYAPSPLVTKEVLDKVNIEILQPAINACKAEGFPFIGCLYAGLMIDNGIPSVVEFNVRFGDPETEAVLPLLNGDFAGLLKSAADGNLQKELVEISNEKASCTVIIASEGYPGTFEKGFEISGIQSAESNGSIVFHAGTSKKEDKIVNSGGRVLAVTAVADNLKTAIEKSYNAVDKIELKNKFFRKDIGKKGLKFIN